ncbi:RIP metalloprotease RseP [Mogibacterium pumilum]|uniref:Zinc metalloprotease n=1 Tax=Mogibacterium pumilum TaxID=86332 RepID=A0A223AUH8_9FIRM|nr:RIP metalloprotease RseP [Mogibacterium pumilum]ASS38555.1 RIP metalloprotease RseP [Mogibacterium pumilum]
MILTVILTIIMLMIITVPHEFGHLVTAKLFHIKVNEFAIGMGPLIASKDKGETKYSVRAVPIGGFCAMEAENEESDEDGAFNNKPAWQRLIVLASGAAVNVLVALVLMIIITIYVGVPTNNIDKVLPDSPAASSGIIAGDEIISIDGKESSSWVDTVTAISKNTDGKTMEVVVSRDGNKHTFIITPKKDKDGRLVIGIVSRASHNVFLCAGRGIKVTWRLNSQMIGALKQMAHKGISKDSVTGPVGMAGLVSKTAHTGILSYLYLVALISLNMAIVNLLPFPALDGGRILFVLIRKITGNAISAKAEGYMHLAGFGMLIALLVFITWQDLARVLGH